MKGVDDVNQKCQNDPSFLLLEKTAKKLYPAPPRIGKESFRRILSTSDGGWKLQKEENLLVFIASSVSAVKLDLCMFKRNMSYGL